MLEMLMMALLLDEPDGPAGQTEPAQVSSIVEDLASMIDQDRAGRELWQPMALADVVRLTRQGPHLLLELPAPAEPAHAIIPLTGQGDYCKFDNTPFPNGGSMANLELWSLITLPAHDGLENAIQNVHVIVSPVSQSIALVRESDDRFVNIQLMIDQLAIDPDRSDSVRLSYQAATELADETDESSRTQMIPAPTFQALLDEPRARPLLEDLFFQLQQPLVLIEGGEDGLRQVLAAEQDPRDLARARELVDQLESDQRNDREQAIQQLQEIARSAPFVLTGIDRTTLGPDQQLTLDSLLASHVAFTPERARELGEDAGYLRYAIYANDPGLQQAGAKRLGRVLGRDLVLKPGLSLAERRQWVRQNLGEAQ